MSSASKRLFEALDAIAAEPAGLGVSELARELEVSRATASRMLASLVEAGLITRTESQRHVLDFRLWVWGLQASSRARRLAVLARPVALHVSRTADILVATSVLYGKNVVFLEVCLPSHGSTIVLPGENPMPAYACAPGKAMLAFASLEKRELALQGLLTRYTEATLATPEQLERELAAIREKGYAVNRQEYLPDTVGIAVPIFEASGAVVAAVSSSGPASEWSYDRLEELVPMLRSISDSVSAALGFSHTANIVG